MNEQRAMDIVVELAALTSELAGQGHLEVRESDEAEVYEVTWTPPAPEPVTVGSFPTKALAERFRGLLEAELAGMAANAGAAAWDPSTGYASLTPDYRSVQEGNEPQETAAPSYTREGESGTAREAPGTLEGRDAAEPVVEAAAPVVGAQPAPPHQQDEAVEAKEQAEASSTKKPSGPIEAPGVPAGPTSGGEMRAAQSPASEKRPNASQLT